MDRSNRPAVVSGDDAAPLLYCATTDGIAVGFPVGFGYGIMTGSMSCSMNDARSTNWREVSETIDNLTRPEHADAIIPNVIAVPKCAMFA